MSDLERSPAVIAFEGFFDDETEELVDAKIEAGTWLAEVISDTFSEALSLMSKGHTIARTLVVAHPDRVLTQEEAIQKLADRDFRLTVDQTIVLAMPERSEDAGAIMVGKWSGWAKPLDKGDPLHARFVEMLASLMLMRRDAAERGPMDGAGVRAEYALNLDAGTISEVKRGQA